jgi:hypothetical protein
MTQLFAASGTIAYVFFALGGLTLCGLVVWILASDAPWRNKP